MSRTLGHARTNVVIVLMGIAGAGKTTVGEQLAGALGWPFVDGDALHPPRNIDKMRRGLPLTDADREPWLARVRECIEDYVRAAQPAVIACSALRHAYRERLRVDPAVRFVYLKGDYALLHHRLRQRSGHFLEAPLLESQFAALEQPGDAITVDAALPVADIVRHVRTALGV